MLYVFLMVSVVSAVLTNELIYCLSISNCLATQALRRAKDPRERHQLYAKASFPYIYRAVARSENPEGGR